MATLPAMQPDMSYVYAILAKRIGEQATRRLSDLLLILKTLLLRFRDNRSAAIVERRAQSVGINTLLIPTDPSYLFFLAVLIDPDVSDLILQKGGWDLSYKGDMKALCQNDRSRNAYAEIIISAFPFLWLVVPKVITHGHSYRGVKLHPDVRIKYAFNPEESQTSEEGRGKLADAYIGLLQHYIYAVRFANAHRQDEWLLPVIATSTGPYYETLQKTGSTETTTVGCCTLAICTAFVTKQAVGNLANLATIPVEEVTAMTPTPEMLMQDGNGSLSSFAGLVHATLLAAMPLELIQLLETRLRQMSPEITQTPGGMIEITSLAHLLLAFVTVPELNNWAIEQLAMQIVQSRFGGGVTNAEATAAAAANPPSEEALRQQRQQLVLREMLAIPQAPQHLMTAYQQMHLMDYEQFRAVAEVPKLHPLVRELNVAVYSSRKSRLDQIKEVGNLVVSVCCQFVKHVRLSGRYNVLVLPSDVVLEEKAFEPIRVRAVGMDISMELYKHFVFTGIGEVDANGFPKKLSLNTQASGFL